jgi:dihydrofolate reductase
VFGRKTYEGLACIWPNMKGDDVGFKGPVNAISKVVASRSLKEPLTWNAKLLKGDFAEGVAAFKNEPGRNIIMYGCGEAAYHLWRRSLVDEIRLWKHPVVFGKGGGPWRPCRSSTAAGPSAGQRTKTAMKSRSSGVR